MKRSHLRFEITSIVVFTIIVFILFRFAVQNYHVSGVSMEPELKNGQLVMVSKFAYLIHSLARGDVIVFHNPQNPNEDLIKRVIGLPGDTIKTDSSNVWVNNVLLNEKSYINAPANTALNPGANTWHVPPNQYFVLGDNRPVSFDSRYLGFIPKDYIVGVAFFVVWPTSSINTHSDVFAKVKNP